jgi:hypothetical protein
MRRARSAQQARAAEETRGVKPSHPSMMGVGSAVLAGGSSCSLRGKFHQLVSAFAKQENFQVKGRGC